MRLFVVKEWPEGVAPGAAGEGAGQRVVVLGVETQDVERCFHGAGL
jgi:hypothetical protein